MAKIGRNEKCPCRSGKKFKHCCALRPQTERKPLSPEQQLKVTLMSAVEKAEAAAYANEATVIELGVFVLYSTKEGDAWVFELTDSDCVQLVDKGRKLQAPINENPETIEIDWSHTFAIKNKQMEITAYTDKAVSILPDAPTKEINATRKRIMKKFTPEQLKEVHISSEKIK